DGGDNSALLFRHGLRLQLKATYDGLVEYQQRLDSLPWRVYWQTLDYQVQQYPHADVLLELYTFSLNEEVLGGSDALGNAAGCGRWGTDCGAGRSHPATGLGCHGGAGGQQ